MSTDEPTEGMPIDLVLVRHGHSEGNLAVERDKDGDSSLLNDPAFKARGSHDWRLTERGRHQARTAGDWLRDHVIGVDGNFDRSYCSSYARTRETAALLELTDARWRLEPLLRERDWGLWDGMPKNDIQDRFPVSLSQKRRNKFLWRPECGESTPDLDVRVREMLGTFARELTGKRVICVTHEDVMWAFRFRLEKLTIDQWLNQADGGNHEIPNCGILHYTRQDAEGTLYPKFVRVRLVDPSQPDSAENWWPIVRPRFTNRELLDQLSGIPPLWE